MTVPVLTAVTGAQEAALVAGLERSAGGVHVVRRCADLPELLAAAGAGLGRAAVVSADLPQLDREAVGTMAAAGVAVVGLSAADDAGGAGRLPALGVRHVLPAGAPAHEVAAAVLAALDDGGGWDAPPEVDDPPPGTGRIVAVWGPVGSPGRTTVATTLAAELAALGSSTLLVDADTYGPSVAQTLGLLDESAGIATAARAAQQGVLDARRLAVLAPLAAARLRVLTGLPRPQRWPELRPSGLDVVWSQARRVSATTVVDCGFGLDVDEELSFDTTAPQRNAATLSALAAADAVLAVGAADPVGLQRLVRGLQDLAEVLPSGRRPQVVLTRVRASAIGPSPQRRLAEALARYAGVVGAVMIPDDRVACDAALLAGRSLTEAAPRSPARLALAGLAADLAADLARRPAAGPAAGQLPRVGA